MNEEVKDYIKQNFISKEEMELIERSHELLIALKELGKVHKEHMKQLDDEFLKTLTQNNE